MSTITTETTTVKPAVTDWLYLSMILLAIAGIGVSAYLLWGYTVPGAELSCSVTNGCEAVKNSPYSQIQLPFVGLEISMPVLGLTGYVSILLLLLAQKQPLVTERSWRPHVALVVFGLSLMGFLYSIYLTYVSKYIIQAVCQWCLVSATIMTLLFLLSIINLNRNNHL